MTVAGSTGLKVGTRHPVKIFANIFISFIGAGVLGLPFAFKEAGILEGIIVMSIVGVISVKAMLLIIDCKYELLRQHPNYANKHRTKPALHVELSYGDVGYHAIGHMGRTFVDVAIVVSQAGSLAITSLMAQVSNLMAFGVVFWFDFEHFHKVEVLIFCIDHDFSHIISFGPETNPIITLNLPKGDSFDFAMIVKSFLCLALFFTYPVMMFPVMKILETYLISEPHKHYMKGSELSFFIRRRDSGIISVKE
ncbi:hypothetical protein KUTeg_024699 [Tegillarca granosa]|uniref:Amino acid transporter transmembrane domain-containing protein n=1 Tax=Tegillarca granosa TaxID=220873 RepID=A0ABQ9E4C7_TEGGR|nr:hypothetical protein KUTeg_024699 [Tegillarca granosa]